MQIKPSLPQFNNKTALIIVAGHQSAEFFIARSGKVELESEIRVNKPEYSDREGYFKRRGLGLTFGSGSVREPKKNKVEREFLHDMRDEILTLTKKDNTISEVYIFSPDYILNRIIKKLPNRTRDNVALKFSGNYTKQHPFDILKKIQEKRGETDGEPPKPEAQKIYDKIEPRSNKKNH